MTTVPTDGTVSSVPLQVRWRDLDPLGHVNYAAYLSFIEEGRNAFLSSLRIPGDAYVVANVDIDFRRELKPKDGDVCVDVQLLAVGRTSVQTVEEVRSAAGLHASATVTSVMWDGERRSSREITVDERRTLTDHLAPGRSSKDGG